MQIQIRRSVRRAATAAALSLAIVAAPSQGATTDINNITLDTTMSRISSSQWTTTAAQNGNVDWRWLSGPGKATVIAANDCATGVQLDSSTFSAGSSAWQRVWNGPAYACFYLRGRTQSGQGAMANPHDGRVRY